MDPIGEHVIDRRPLAQRPMTVLILAVALVVAGCWSTPATSTSPAPSAGAVLPTPALAPTCTRCPSPSTAPPSLAPTPVPTATPTPTPRSTTTPKPTPRPTAIPPSPRAPSELVRHGSRASHEIALTFDMGGRVGDALAIVAWLVDRRVHATIFMTGAMVDNPNTDAGRQVLAIIDAHPELFTLGNHSYSHRDFRTLNTSEIRDELRRTAEVLGRYGSQDPRPFFRPPNGGYDADVLAAVGASGYRYTVTWDIDTIDWRPIKNDPPGPTADAIVAKVLGNAQGGSIVLMHLGGYETFEALPRIVDGLEAARYDLVTLDELVGG